MKKKLVIFGTGQIAELADYYFTEDSDFEVVSFCLDAEYIGEEKQFKKRPIVAFEEVEKQYPPDDHWFFAAVSYTQLNAIRKEKFIDAKKKSYRIANYISSRATVLTDLGSCENCFILENNTIQPFSTIGKNVTLWSGNHIGHHSTIGDHCFVSSHVVISGNVQIGESCFLGVNSTLKEGIQIGPNNVLAANAFIGKDTSEGGVYVGSPAKRIKSISEIDI